MIPENQYPWQLEPKREIASASRSVLGLLVGDSSCLPFKGSDLTKTTREREEIWLDTACQFSPNIRSRIMEIRRALQNGATIPKGLYPQGLAALRKAGFSEVQMGGKQILLADLFYARIAGLPGEINRWVDLDAEAVRMREELLDSRGILSLESLTLEQIIEAVLTGSVNLACQT